MMTGILIGMALVIGGGVLHDENFKPNDPRLRRMDPDRWSRHREGAGYLLGTVGGAVLAWHLHDYLADQDRWKLPLPLTLGLTQSLVGTLVGGGLVGVGLIVHEDRVRGDRDTRYYERQRTNDYREHAGYLLGPLGAATVTLSIKGYLSPPSTRGGGEPPAWARLRAPALRVHPAG